MVNLNYIFFRGKRFKFPNHMVILTLNMFFILAPSTDPVERLHSVAFHQGSPCLLRQKGTSKIEKQFLENITYSRTCVKQPLSKRQKNVFQDQLSLNAGQKYCILQYF